MLIIGMIHSGTFKKIQPADNTDMGSSQKTENKAR